MRTYISIAYENIFFLKKDRGTVRTNQQKMSTKQNVTRENGIDDLISIYFEPSRFYEIIIYVSGNESSHPLVVFDSVSLSESMMHFSIFLFFFQN